jgi:hypothetical protein
VKITAVTPTDAASDPAHPDHDRWVKETTLKLEVEHAQRVGLSFRDAESANAYWLARAEAKARVPVAPSSPAPRKDRTQRLAERGVTVTAPKVKKLKPSPCGRWGAGRNRMGERRVVGIMAKRKEDKFFAALAEPLIRASYRLGSFAGLSKREYERAVVAACEAACDASIPRLGRWF